MGGPPVILVAVTRMAYPLLKGIESVDEGRAAFLDCVGDFVYDFFSVGERRSGLSRGLDY